MGRCPHDSQRMAKVGGHGQGGRAAAGRQRAGCMHDLTQTELAEDRGMERPSHACRRLKLLYSRTAFTVAYRAVYGVLRLYDS